MVLTFSNDERSDSVVLHKKARSYLRSARHLNAANPSASGVHAGVTFLFCHAVELFLMAYLRAQGAEREELINLKRRLAAATSKAVDAGLKLHPDALETLSQIADTLISIEVHYLLTGIKQMPTIEPLSHAAKQLDVAVSKALVDLGLPLSQEIPPKLHETVGMAM